MADEYFLEIDGIEGESHDARHQDEIELDGWSFGGAASGSFQAGGGAGAGKFNAQDFQFTAKVSKASPLLFQACATGKHLPRATLTARKAGANPQDYLKITQTDVLIASYQQSGSSGSDAPPRDQVSLTYAKIELEYKPMNPDGSLGGSVKAGFDLKTNRPV
ncbi:MAG: type VI secretion system tube protein Hcp [Nitrospira sp.]|nr:type VI secretion system tube protein Hcp [Nitrospira sp.]MDH4244210.1 type VI secretion system tube protein Hcp [Nitrospira sp.]MDH4356745.1 type VI secretion system tube protein Hcp [Nitrospira sp.]MDH5318439.1 type VI secretion system tube protein Hcp [Nitrospira sp.]